MPKSYGGDGWPTVPSGSELIGFLKLLGHGIGAASGGLRTKDLDPGLDNNKYSGRCIKIYNLHNKIHVI